MLDIVDKCSEISRSGDLCVGQIIHVTSQGKPLVDFPGNPLGPVEARVACPSTPNLWNAGGHQEGVSALLMFENGDTDFPIVVGIIQDTFEAPHKTQDTMLETHRPCQIQVDGRMISFNAKEEIVLRCGKSSLMLRKDGKIVVKGTHVSSRASGKHKIKGGSVAIN